MDLDNRHAVVKDILRNDSFVFFGHRFLPEHFYILKPYTFVERINNVYFTEEVFAEYKDFVLVNNTHSYLHYTKLYVNGENRLINNDFKLFIVCDPHKEFRFGKDIEIDEHTFEASILTRNICNRGISDRSEL